MAIGKGNQKYDSENPFPRDTGAQNLNVLSNANSLLTENSVRIHSQLFQVILHRHQKITVNIKFSTPLSGK